MTVDPGVLVARIARIRDELRLLGRLRGMKLEDFLASTIEQHATERELQIVIEACLDIGHHVIAREGLRRPGDYKEVFAILGEAGIVPKPLVTQLRAMAGLRNVLTHMYLDVDAERVFRFATRELGDVEAFVQAVVKRYGLG
jgi:uncharacterized protein YutE (UPF0331/DUF86 family)